MMTDEYSAEQSKDQRSEMIDAAMAALRDQLSARDDRIAALEQRLEDQEYSVRRVLDMLIEWLEEPSRDDGQDGREAA